MTPDLLSALRVERRDIRARVALHVARSTVIQPEAFGELLVGDILRRMPYTRDERARELAKRADVAEMRRPVDLWTEEREALARQIARFAKELRA